MRLYARGLRAPLSAVFTTVALAGVCATAQAQTTVTLDQPRTQVTDTTIRGGDFASSNFGTDLLATRASDNATYERRALLAFDTEATIPSGATITSATLTLVIHWGGVDPTRRVAAYYVTAPFNDQEATWLQRTASAGWSSAGGDLAPTEADIEIVGNNPDSPVTFDLTDLVQAVVNGQADPSSRKTRIALMDLDAPSRASYRDYYSSEDPNANLRPVLSVTYTTDPVPAPPPPPPPPDPSSLRVMHWNTHHGGYRTDGVWDVAGLIAWVVKLNPDIVSLNEVEQNDGYSHGQDDAQMYASLLHTLTGDDWHAVFVVGAGGSSGIGNAILSKTAFTSTSSTQLQNGRAAVQASIAFNGRTINLISTHLDDKSSASRLGQIGELLSWADGFPQERIIAGDFNASDSTTEHAAMTAQYVDDWAAARGDGTAVAYPGNANGNTRNGRIDYIFTSKAATHLHLQRVQVFDTRGPNGVMPSDHRPVLAIYAVK